MQREEKATSVKERWDRGIRERWEEEEDGGRELRDLEEGEQQAREVEGRLDGLLAEQGRVQEEKAGITQGGLDGHWRRLEEDWKAVEEKQKERQSRLENLALEREDFETRVNDQVDHHHCDHYNTSHRHNKSEHCEHLGSQGACKPCGNSRGGSKG